MRSRSMQASWAVVVIPCGLALAVGPVGAGCVDDSETGLTQTDDNHGPDTGDSTACRRDSDCAALAELGECEIGVCRTSTGECVVAIAGCGLDSSSDPSVPALAQRAAFGDVFVSEPTTPPPPEDVTVIAATDLVATDSAQRVDAILVFDRGRIVASGTPAELRGGHARLDEFFRSITVPDTAKRPD